MAQTIMLCFSTILLTNIFLIKLFFYKIFFEEYVNINPRSEVINAITLGQAQLSVIFFN